LISHSDPRIPIAIRDASESIEICVSRAIRAALGGAVVTGGIASICATGWMYKTAAVINRKTVGGTHDLCCMMIPSTPQVLS